MNSLMTVLNNRIRLTGYLIFRGDSMDDLDLFENLPKAENGVICVWDNFEADCSKGISIFKLFGIQDVSICKAHYDHHVKVMTLYDRTEIDIEDIIVMSVEEIDKKISGLK